MDWIAANLIFLLQGAWENLSARIESVAFSFAPLGGWLLGFGVAGAVILAILAYVRTTEGLTIRMRISLAVLRWVALVCLLVITAGTVCRIRLLRTEHPRLVVLVDDSASMELRTSETSRQERVAQALEGGLLEHLRRTHDVQVMSTSEALQLVTPPHPSPTPQTAAASAPASPPEGPSEPDRADRALPQNLAEAVVRASPGERETWPPDQLLLISDGVQVGRARLAEAEPLVSAPISALLVGSLNDIRDLQIHTVDVPPFAYQHDRVPLAADLRSLGVEGEAQVRLIRLDGRTEKELASTRVALRPDGSPVPARLEFTADQAGLQRFLLKVDPVNGEVTERNNGLRFHLEILDEKIRVFFAEGNPSWEYRFAKTAFEGDPAIQFHGLTRIPPDEWFYQGPATRPDQKPVLADPKKGLPVDLDELAYFDVVILGDLERKVFEESDRFGLFDQYVRERGGGLATLGGFSVYGAGHFEGTPLARLIPFRLDEEKKTQLVNRFNVQLTAQGFLHPITQLEFDPVKNEQAWSGLPWVEGGNALSRVKASATTLLEHPSLRTRFGNRPVAAVWECGRGRVYSTALDGTWHWSMARTTDEDYHRRYWGLLARWLAGDIRVLRHNALILETAICEAGRPVTVSITLRNPAGFPLADAAVSLSLQGPGAEKMTVALTGDPSVPGRYGMTFVPGTAGDCQVEADCRLADGTNFKRQLSFVVDPSREEYLEIRPDAEALSRLASATGGAVATLENYRQLPLKPGPGATRVVDVTVSVWQLPGLLLVFLGCAMTEWALRKRRGLA